MNHQDVKTFNGLNEQFDRLNGQLTANASNLRDIGNQLDLLVELEATVQAMRALAELHR